MACWIMGKVPCNSKHLIQAPETCESAMHIRKQLKTPETEDRDCQRKSSPSLTASVSPKVVSDLA